VIKPRRIKSLFSLGGLLSFREASDAPGEEAYIRRRPKVSECRSAEEMALADEVARILASNLEIEQVYHQMFEALREVVDYDRGGLTLLDTGGKSYSVKHLVLDTPSRRRVGDQVPLGDSYSGEVLSIGRSIVRGTIPDDSELPQDQACIRIGIRSIVAVPLVLDGLIAGTITISSTHKGAYGPKELTLLEGLAAQIAPVVSKSILSERLFDAQIALRQSEERFRTFVERAADPIFVVDRDGRFVEVKDAVGIALGYSRSELLTMSVPDVSIGVTSEWQEGTWERLNQGETITGEREYRHKDRTSFPVEFRLSLIEIEGQQYKLVLARDLTERKHVVDLQRRSTEEISVMAEIGKIISSSLNVDDVYERFANEVRKLIPFDRLNLRRTYVEEETSRWVRGEGV